MLAWARDTVDEVAAAGGAAWAVEVDVTEEASLIRMVDLARRTVGGVDILHNNVGVSLGGGDATLTEIDMDALARIMSINLHGIVVTCKHVVQIMQGQGSGVILTVGSLASVIDYRYVAFKTSKTAVASTGVDVALRLASVAP